MAPSSKVALRAVPSPAAPALEPVDLKSPTLYINRELSWLEFNQRVLAQALDPAHPLLERVKFLAINASNLDEFFMIRVSTTQKRLREGIEDIAPDGFNTEQQLEAMRARARRMLQDQAACWAQLRELLATIDRNLTRSSSGCAGSSAWVSTRWLKSSQLSSRLM